MIVHLIRILCGIIDLSQPNMEAVQKEVEEADSMEALEKDPLLPRTPARGELTAEKTELEKQMSEKERIRQQDVTVNHIFLAIGTWNTYYIRVILLNSVLWALASATYASFAMKKTERREYVYTDCDGTIFESLPNAKLFTDHQSLFRQDMEANHLFLSTLVGMVLGFSICCFMHKFKRPTLVVIGGIVVAICTLVGYIDYFDINRMGTTCLYIGIKLVRVGTLLHCTESVPAHIRPIALLTMYIMALMFNSIFYLGLHTIPNWRLVLEMLGGAYLLSLLVYFICIPPGVMTALTNNDKLEIQYILDHWAADAVGTQGVRRRGLKLSDTSVEKLLDDTAYRGHVTFSIWESIMETLRIRPYRTKLIIIVMNRPLIALLEASTDRYESIHGIGVFEAEMRLIFREFIAVTLACVMIYKWGRRRTAIVLGAVIIIGNIMMLFPVYSEFNVCTVKVYPTEGFASLMASAGLTTTQCGYKGAEFLFRLWLIEHIPSSSRSFLLPILFMIFETISVVVKKIDNKLTTIDYPNAPLFLSFVIAMIILPFNTILDNSNHLAMTTGEIPCYYTDAMKYDNQPALDDAGKLTETTSSEKRSTQSQDSKTLPSQSSANSHTGGSKT